ncbi:MAG: hypothetical protein IPM76_18475 [Chloroflexi bacterium]|nr:hypothetical protein [Chloroflexota bacterium]
MTKTRITHHYHTHHASRITHHASRITHHASRITHHASRITHHASRITHPSASKKLYVPLLSGIEQAAAGFNSQFRPRRPKPEK